MASTRNKTDYPGVYYRIAKRKGGKGEERVYYITFKDSDGKKIEEKAGRQFSDAMTPARAASYRASRIEGKIFSRKEIRAQREAAKAQEVNKWTIRKLWDEYSSHKDVSTKSFYSDNNRFTLYLADKFGDKEPKDLIPLDVDRLRINLLKVKSPQTTKHVLMLLKRIVNFGMNKGLCEGTGFKIAMPRVDNQKTEDLTPEQLKRLLDAIDADENIQAAAMMRFVLFTGMRRGELFKLKWDDIDFHRGFIHIRNPKGGADQKIPLNEGARQILENHIRTGSEYIFPGRNGERRTDLKRPANRIKKRAGLPDDFRPLHGLRHAYASMLASSGKVDLYTLQRLLTHKSTQMTARYAHLRDEALQKASDVAGDIINQAANGNGKVVNIK